MSAKQEANEPEQKQPAPIIQKSEMEEGKNNSSLLADTIAGQSKD